MKLKLSFILFVLCPILCHAGIVDAVVEIADNAEPQIVTDPDSYRYYMQMREALEDLNRVWTGKGSRTAYEQKMNKFTRMAGQINSYARNTYSQARSLQRTYEYLEENGVDYFRARGAFHDMKGVYDYQTEFWKDFIARIRGTMNRDDKSQDAKEEEVDRAMKEAEVQAQRMMQQLRIEQSTTLFVNDLMAFESAVSTGLLSSDAARQSGLKHYGASVDSGNHSSTVYGVVAKATMIALTVFLLLCCFYFAYSMARRTNGVETLLSKMFFILILSIAYILWAQQYI